MRRTALRCAAALVVLMGASGCAVRTVDCWQLDDPELAELKKTGHCGDAFARNSHEIVPLAEIKRQRVGKAAVKAVEPAAETKPAKGKAKRKKSAEKNVAAKQAKLAPTSGRGG